MAWLINIVLLLGVIALLLWDVRHHAQSVVALLGSAPARLLHLFSARLVALGSSALPGWAPATGIPATASGAPSELPPKSPIALPSTTQVLAFYGEIPFGAVAVTMVLGEGLGLVAGLGIPLAIKAFFHALHERDVRQQRVKAEKKAEAKAREALALAGSGGGPRRRRPSSSSMLAVKKARQRG